MIWRAAAPVAATDGRGHRHDVDASLPGAALLAYTGAAMKITLEYVATLHLKDPASGSEIELADGTSVTDLFNQLGIRATHQRVLIAFINEEKVHKDTKLSDGDHLFIGMPVGGG